MSVKRFYLVAVLGLLGCASPPGTSEMAKPSAPRKATLLTADEISAADADNASAFEAVARLRPMWLAKRAPNSFYSGEEADHPALFVDGQAVPDFNTLRTIAANDVADIRYYRPEEAGGAFGIRAGHSGALEVRLKIATHPPVP